MSKVDVRYCEPYWYSNLNSPYYKDTHHRFRKTVREFIEKEYAPYIDEWAESGTYPIELLRKAYESGIYAAMWPKEYGGTPPENCDVFHDLILLEELGRYGFDCNIFFTFTFGLPPILAVGSKQLKDRIARDVLTANKFISLCITEPSAGSDVSTISTTAVKHHDEKNGDFYLVNGVKKFITGGLIADYFTVAVRTGGEGMNGVSLLLIERDRPGVKVTKMKTQGSWLTFTSLVAFNDVRVPTSNLIGVENSGFRSIMHCFNHERFVFACIAVGAARGCIEDSIKYARLRKTFGKRLIDHQVIRHKLAEMIMKVEACYALIEQVAYQMNQTHNKTIINAPELGGQIGLTKVFATRTLEFCAREASQILGGASYIRGGPGQRIERIYRDVRHAAIAGGSEEVMMDLGMKQSKL